MREKLYINTSLYKSNVSEHQDAHTVTYKPSKHLSRTAVSLVPWSLQNKIFLDKTNSSIVD
jgi:hypothetical protein